MGTGRRERASGLQRARRAAYAAAWVAAALIAPGCSSTPTKESTTEHRDLGLGPNQLEEYGLAIITPSTVTGQEEEKQAVGFVFADVLKRERPGVRLVVLSETLSAINAAGFADEYRKAYQEYRESGIFRRDALARIGEVTGARYVAALKLSSFGQSSENRFSVFGLRILDTKHASIRLFLQIWDGQTGGIVWEGLQESSSSEEAVTEHLVTLQQSLGEACAALIDSLPGRPEARSPAP